MLHVEISISRFSRIVQRYKFPSKSVVPLVVSPPSSLDGQSPLNLLVNPDIPSKITVYVYTIIYTDVYLYIFLPTAA